MRSSATSIHPWPIALVFLAVSLSGVVQGAALQPAAFVCQPVHLHQQQSIRTAASSRPPLDTIPSGCSSTLPQNPLGLGRVSRRPLRVFKLVARSENLAIGVGSASLSALLINRLVTLDLANAQSRADLLGVAVASAVLVSALSRIDLTVREKESVSLAGVDFDEILTPLPPDSEKLLRYAAGTILQVCESAKSVVVYAGDGTVARIGTMGRAQQLQVGPIVGDVIKKGKQAYLADLQILPGRVEFGFLPVNTQAVLIQPVGSDGVMVVGANKIRPFTGRDLVMIERLAPLVASALGGA